MNSRPQIILLGSQLIKCWGVYLNRPRVHFTERIHVQYFKDFFTKESSLINLRGYPGCQRYFFSLGATELSGEAAKASREAARKKPLAPTDNNLTSMPTPVSFD